jgi:hypothetical protein
MSNINLEDGKGVVSLKSWTNQPTPHNNPEERRPLIPTSCYYTRWTKTARQNLLKANLRPNVRKIFIVDLDLLEHGFRVTACWQLRKLLNLSTYRRTLHVWTVIAWPTGDYRGYSNHVRYFLYSLLQVLEFTDCCSVNSRLQMSSEVKSKGIKPSDRAGNVVGPPTCCSWQTFGNPWNAGRKRGGASCMDHK